MATLPYEPYKIGSYVLGCFSARLGESFIKGAHEALHSLFESRGLLERTWLDSYVKPFWELCSSISKHSPKNANNLIDKFDELNWQKHISLRCADIVGEELAVKTTTKSLKSVQLVCLMLYRTQVVPWDVKVDGIAPRLIASAADSIFTKRGWAKVEKTSPKPSPSLHVSEKHGRAYDYTKFVDHFGIEFIRSCVKELGPYLDALNTVKAKRAHQSLLSILGFAVENASKLNYATDIEEFLNYSTSERFWDVCGSEWRTHQLTRIKRQTVALKVANLNEVVSYLYGRGVLPFFKVTKIRGHRLGSNSDPRKTVAQIGSYNLPTETINILWSRYAGQFSATEERQGREYISALAAEIGVAEVSQLSIDSLLERINTLNVERLSELRAHAESEFLTWYKHWSAGQHAINDGGADGAVLSYLVDSPDYTVYERRKFSAFYLFDAPASQRLGNCLRYVWHTHQGLIRGIHGRYHHIMRSWGGRQVFHAYLFPHDFVAINLWIMLMVDTNANSEVVRNMPLDCLENTEDLGVAVVHFDNKARAGNAPILDHINKAALPDQKLSAYQAILAYKEMSAEYRKMAPPDVASRLLIYDHSDGFKVLSEFTGRSRFNAFIVRHNLVAGMLPGMLRASVLMREMHKSNYDVLASQVLADHRSAATTMQSYVGRTPTQMQFQRLIRDFQDRFEAMVIAPLHGAPQKLGLNQQQYSRLFEEASRTGLGVVCLDAYAGVQPGSEAGIACTKVTSCPGCTMRYVIGTKRNIADVILFNDFLESRIVDLCANQSDEIQKEWLEWLGLTRVIIAKSQVGDMAKIYLDAKEIAALETDEKLAYFNFIFGLRS
ncbi:hypothetical protein ACOZ4J_27325 [Pseudomonas syringae pv. actinidiae]|uniref:hypothetical protein n=1 Tax=Pseudomonas syringae TaxID=317 RepID=UPI003DA88120